MTPYIYIQDDRFVGEGTVEKEFHPGRDGAAAPDFEAIDVLVDVGEKSVEYILQQDASQPFFTYIPLASPHTSHSAHAGMAGEERTGTLC